MFKSIFTLISTVLLVTSCSIAKTNSTSTLSDNSDDCKSFGHMVSELAESKYKGVTLEEALSEVSNNDSNAAQALKLILNDLYRNPYLKNASPQEVARHFTFLCRKAYEKKN